MQGSVKRDAFVFYRSFFECLENLATEDKAAAYEMFRALCSYALDGTEPELKGSLAAIFSAIKPNLDASRKKAEAGCKGGKTTSKAEADTSKTEADTSKTEADTSKAEADTSKAEADTSKAEKAQAIKIKDKGQGTRDKGQEIKDKRQGTSPQSPPEGAGVYSPEFERFWSAYPRKLDKGNAYKKYKARLKDGYTPAQLETAARSYAQECSRQKTEETFIKHPKTFLSDALPFADFIPKATEPEVLDPDENPFKEWL